MISVLNTDVKRALRAYGDYVEQGNAVLGSNPRMNAMRARCAADAAAVWANDLSPAFRAGWDVLIQAASYADVNLQTLSGTLVVQKSLELLRYNYPVLTRVITDYSQERAGLNQETMSRTTTLPAVKAYSTATGWADATLTATDVPITIDKHIGVPLTFNANQVQGTLRQLFDEMAPAASAAIAKEMVTSLYALITAGNFSVNAPVVSDLLGFGRGTVVDCATALTLKGVQFGPDERTFLLAPAYFGQLSKDPAILTLASPGQPDSDQQGALSVADFKAISSPSLPTTGNLCGFAFGKSALCIATRLPGDYMKAMPQASYGDAYVITDPQLGISVQVICYVNHTMGTATRRLALMYGVAVGQAAAGQIFTSK